MALQEPLGLTISTGGLCRVPPLAALYVRAKGSAVDSVKYFIECGIKLKAVKDSLTHGKWIPWLEENKEVLGFKERASRYLLKAAERYRQSTADLEESEALQMSRRIWDNDATGLKGHVSKDRNWYTPVRWQ